MKDVFVIGTGMTRFAKHLERSEKNLVSEAVNFCLTDAGVSIGAIQSAWFSNSMWGYFSDQHCIRGQVALQPLGIEGIPITNVENACAGGSTAFHHAWYGVAGGLYDCVLAVGVEKLYSKDRLKTFRAYSTGTDVENIESQFEAWRNVLDGLELEVPGDDSGQGAGENRSAFMDVYAGMSRWHMAKYGTTQRQLAVIASKNHYHSSMNPNAQFQKIMSVDEILTGQPVIFPLTVPMCAPVGDGSAAAILCSGSFLKRLNSSRSVKVLASVLGSGTGRQISEEKKDIAYRLSQQAYEIAGIGPEDIHLAEVHDATSFGELHQTEALGFCSFGKGGEFAESGATTLGGKLPVNPSGGLESRGHPVGASGLGQIHEIVTQLRHEAGPRQVENCRIGLTENGGGNIGYEEAAMGIHILERVD
ncbi:MAG: thiolase family protein [Dissulfuribacterales bacterium]